MEEFVKGDVLVVPFPFSDLSGAKKRPVLLIAVLKRRRHHPVPDNKQKQN